MRLAALCQEPITSTLHGLTHLSHTTNLWGRYYCPVLQRRKRSCQRPLAQVPDLWRGQADWRLRSHVPWEASPLRTPGGNLLFPFLRQLCADLDYSIFSGRLPLLVSEASFCPCGDLLGAMVHYFTFLILSPMMSPDWPTTGAGNTLQVNQTAGFPAGNPSGLFQECIDSVGPTDLLQEEGLLT